MKKTFLRRWKIFNDDRGELNTFDVKSKNTEEIVNIFQFRLSTFLSLKYRFSRFNIRMLE
jgi:hypothetical protein